LDENVVIRLLRTDDPEAFIQIMESYNSYLWVIAGGILNRVGSRADVEECISDVYVRLWRNRKAYDPQRGTLKAYLATLAKSIALNKYKQLTRVRTVPFEDAPVATTDDLLTQITDREQYQALYDAIKTLKEPDREIIIRRYFYDEKPSGIAARIPLPVKEVENRLYQTKLRLQTAAQTGGTVMNQNLFSHLNEQEVEEMRRYAPEQTGQSDDNIRQRFLSKTALRRRPWSKRALIAAIAVAALLVITFAAMTASGHDFFGNLFRFGSFFDNPDATDKNKIGQTFKKDGMEVTLVSAFVDNSENSAEVLLLVEFNDTTGELLSNHDVSLSSKYTSSRFWISEVTCNKERTRITQVLNIPFNHPVKVGEKISLDIDALLFGVLPGTVFDLDFDIAENAKACTPITREEWSKAANAGSARKTELFPDTTPDYISGFLPLDQTDIEVEGLGWWRMSNIGIIDDMLHFQFKNTAPFDTEANNPMSIFLADDNGIKHIDSCAYMQQGDYCEIVFYIGDNRPLIGEYRGRDAYIGDNTLDSLHMATYGNDYEHTITGPWELSFTVESEVPKKRLTVNPTDMPYIAQLDITCSPMSTQISVTFSEDFTNDPDSPNAAQEFEQLMAYMQSDRYLTLADGTRIELTTGDSMTMPHNPGDMYSSFRSAYYSVEDLRSITYYGKTFVFD